MLLAIVALFLLCNCLAFCISIVESIMLIQSSNSNESAIENEDEMQQLVKLFECSVEISNVLITLNSSTSAVVYLIFSSKYRLVLKTIMHLKKRKKVNKKIN